MMSGSSEQKIVAKVVEGDKNTFINSSFNVIGQQVNQHTSTSNVPTRIWFEVREPVRSFTGIEKELENLHKLVQRNCSTVISQITSISGLGGIGKSEIARMYAHLHGHEYDGNVIWINAETYATLTESFHRLAKDKLNISAINIDGEEKNMSSIVQEVYEYFRNRKSLFIFDNAEKMRTEKEEDEGIDKFLAYFMSSGDNKPYIIITSRNREWGNEIEVIELDTFTEEEAINFIKKELNLNDDSREEDVRLLAKTLQYFPLALQQAIAYIRNAQRKLKKSNNQNFEIVNYLKMYQENATILLDYNFTEENDNSYIKTTFITWEITLKKIQQKKHGQLALNALHILAYLAPDNIPTQIFVEIAKSDKENLESILELLSQFSMINLENGINNIHRLVQQVTRENLKQQKKEHNILWLTIKQVKSHLETAS